PFLILPAESTAAARSLAIYCPQSRRARTLTGLMRLAFAVRLGFLFPKTAIGLLPEDPLARFIASLAGEISGKFPNIAILAGNPAVAGWRFIVLVLDRANRPVAVIKTGLGESAQALIRREGAFLESVPAGTPGVPRVLAALDSSRIQGFALEFFGGHSP